MIKISKSFAFSQNKLLLNYNRIQFKKEVITKEGQILLTNKNFKIAYIHRYDFNSNQDNFNTKKEDLINKSYIGYSKKMKIMLKEYGYAFLAYWTTLWFVSGVSIFVFIQTYGNEIVMQQFKLIINYFKLENYIELENVNTTWGNIALAYGINGALNIFRLPFCFITLPIILKMIKKMKK